jgi:TonB-linked SusC/RagA family outer membrane protein
MKKESDRKKETILVFQRYLIRGPIALLILIVSTNLSAFNGPGMVESSRNSGPDGMNVRYQDEKIVGKVTSQEGESLAGVAVQIKGTLTGTVTDINGNYSLQIKDGAGALVFSYVGMLTQEIDIAGRTTVDVVLLPDVIGIDEVVVIGYGTSSMKKLTTSVSNVKADKLNNLPIANIANSFTGNVSGVLVEEGSGAPGSTPVIRVRGYGSINAGSEPLYVIDGMIVSSTEFRLLNPKSVESVNVLKDAAAGAIYGSRAGNGVVIVTTKGGEGKAKFSYNSTIGWQQVEKKIPVLSGPEYIEYSKIAYQASGQPEPVFSSDVANTNWQDEIFRKGLLQNHQFAANGSSDRVKYNISFNYMDEEGIIITTYEKNYSSNGNFDIKLNDKLKLGLTYNATYSKGRVNNKLGDAAHGSGGILEDAIVQYPVIPVYMPNGDYGQQVSKDWGTPVVYNGYGNPVAGLKEIFDYRYGFSGIGRTFLNYEPIHDLNINLSVSGLMGSGYRNYYESPYVAAQGHSNDANFSHPRYDDILAGQSNELRTKYTTEGFIGYKRSFSGSHNFGIIAGFSNEYTGYRGTSADASVNDRGANATDPLPRFDNYIRPNIWGANDVRGGGGFSEETFVSVFGRLNYDFKDKYLFMASIRRDGSSKFAPGNRYGIFPAISAAWRITEESFMKSQNLFDELKLRLSYGVSGNDQIGSYSWQGRANYGGFQYIYGPGNSITSAYPSSIQNPNLKWETNEQYNAGFDFSILRNRIQLASDFYVRNTKDMLLQRPLPTENGISSTIMDNIGDLTNKGIELALTTVNLKRGEFTWTTNWIFNKVWNKATAIHTKSGIIRLGSGAYDMVWIVEGEEMFQIYGYKNIGVFKTEEELTQHPRPRGSKIGDPIYFDANEDGILNSDDYQKLGHGLPNFTYGWSNTFTYKNFDLSFVIDGSQGASKYVPAFRNQNWISPIEGNLSKYIYDRAGTKYGAPNLDYTGNRLERCSYDVFDASYVRIKNLTIGYDLPAHICSSLSITRLRLIISAQNLHTFSSYPWYSPQANYYNGAAGVAQFGVDYGSYPLAKSYTFGINLTF